MTCETIKQLRSEMDRLMRKRGISRLNEAQNPAPVHSRITDVDDNRPFFTGYDNGRLFGWDQYFEGILQIYAGWELTYLRNSLKLFLERVNERGFIPRTLPVVWWGMVQAQPFLAQQAVLLWRAGDDLHWFFPEYFYNCKRYLMHWLREMDIRGEGLSVCDHSGHCGIDNQYERAGTFYDAYAESVDLNSYLVRELDAFALLARIFGCHSDIKQFEELAAIKREAMNRWLWDDEEGIYLDYHARHHHPIPVKYAGAFSALWAGVPGAEQAERLVGEHLMNPDEFWRSWPVPALAATEPGYLEGYLPVENLPCCSWRAHTWLPANYYIIQGLRRYGYQDQARQLIEKSEALFLSAPFREYYGSESGEAQGRDPFWGWSSLALYLREERECGFDPTRIEAAPFAENWMGLNK